ncbi:hypothetical protein [Afipia carboxidovorans]|uniref:phage adaptor protein n=1 Tax=Afipia carboxidovorans TaxID=40137 RepID=UPI00308544A1|nr:hypothetical protein CRBSH125_09500 [Afipia carboxidovorans]
MTLLSIAANVATNVGVKAPTSVLTNTSDKNADKIAVFSAETCDELARRADWASLRKTVTVTGTGNPGALALPSDFLRLIAGMSVKTSAGMPVRTGLSPDEWNSLTPVEGTPRFAMLQGGSISFYPYLAYAATATVTYQSNAWGPSGAKWSNDGDVPLLPERLVTQGTIWRWRRQLGQDFQDYLAEYEAAIADYAKFDEGMRSP